MGNMASFSDILYLLCIMYYCYVATGARKSATHKGQENDVIPHQKYMDRYSGSDSFDNEIGKVSSRQRPRHLKGFPRFDVIKCFVEGGSMTFANGTRRPLPDNFRLHGAACRHRYRRHQHSKTTKVKDGTGKNENDAGAPPMIPEGTETCTAIAKFLSEKNNLRLVRQKADGLTCGDDDVSRRFRALENLDRLDTSEEEHGTRMVRKWKQLACRAYQGFVDCLKATTSPSDGDVDGEDDVDGDGEEKDDREAVHISNSSRVDFLNFMIGHDTEFTDDYQMWFY